jgi:hypothetical protein
VLSDDTVQTPVPIITRIGLEQRKRKKRRIKNVFRTGRVEFVNTSRKPFLRTVIFILVGYKRSILEVRIGRKKDTYTI